MSSADDTEKYLLSDDERTVFSALYIILAIPIFIGNLWIILAILLSKKLRCSTTNWIVLWLCANRLAPFATRIPMTVVAFLHKNGWPSEIPETICEVFSGIDTSVISSTSFGILMLAINRWTKTTKPAKTYNRWFNRCTISLYFSIVMVVNFLFTGLPPVIGFGSYGYNNKYQTCSTDDEHKFNDYFAWIVVTFSFPMQYIFTIYFFVKTFNYTRDETKKGTKTFDSRLLTVTRVQFVVVIMMIILYLPYIVLYAIPADLSYPFRNYGLLILTFSDALVPVILLGFHPDIKATCREMYKATMTHGHDMRNVVD